MSEMTLEQAIAKLDSKLCTASEYATAWPIVKAHLTRAPGQVTDEDAEYDKWFRGEQGKPYDGMWQFAKAAWNARASLSARLAQPVVPKDCELGCNTYCRAEAHGCASECPALSQPHPQAAQGELSGNSGVLDGPKTDREMLVYIDQQLDFQVWNCPRCGWDEPTKEMDIAGEIRQYLANYPAERAAVPEGMVLDALNEAGRRYPEAGDAIAWLSGALSAAPTLAGKGSYQQRVAEWMQQAFIPSLYSNMTERGDRLLEEVLELLQSHGYDPARVATLVQYVFGRPAGEPAQEVGGVMVTLAGYCFIAGLDMHAAGEAELARICQPEVMAKIRAKQEAKNALHFDTPLPGQLGESEAPAHG